jgi:unsaturated rhamnogalacturonyl hydrolase
MSATVPPASHRLLSDALAPFGTHVAPFVHGYVQSWRPYKPSWNYEDGCIWKGCLDLAEASGQRFLADFVYREVSARVAGDGAISGYSPDEFNIDNVNPGRVLAILLASTGERRFRLALDAQIAQLARHPRTQSGNYWHKQIYPNQVWLDGLYMAQPMRCSYATLTGDGAIVADVIRQFEFVHAHLRDARSGLLFHGWDESRAERWSNPASGCSPNFWGRAMGWYAMALVDCIDLLRPGSLLPGAMDRLAAIFAEVVDALLRVRSESGLWLQILDRADEPGNYEESSASLMIAYALMKAARLGLVDQSTGQTGRDALTTCVDRFLDDTHLHSICGVAGLGNTPYRDGSVAYYLSEPIVANDPKGVAALFMALGEALR